MVTLTVCGFELVQNSIHSIGEKFGFLDTNMDHEDENGPDDFNAYKGCLIGFETNFSKEPLFSQKHLSRLRFELPKHPDQWIFSPPPNSVEH